MLRRFLFHNFRLVFAVDRWVRRRFTTAGMLVLGGMIAASVFGIDTRQTLAYQLFSLLLALLTVAFISTWFFRIRLTIERHLPQFVTVDDTIQYRIRLYNHTRWLQRDLSLIENITLISPTFAEFVKAKEPGEEKRNRFDAYVGYPRWVWLMSLRQGAIPIEHPLPPLPPSAALEVRMSLTPLHRGYVHLNGVTIIRPEPFGLINALCKVSLPDSLLVLPKRYPVGEIPLPGSRKYQRGGINLAMSVGDAQEFVSLREYRSGDPLRHIHWKSWAKLGKPVVKELQDEFFVRHALILDTFTTPETESAFEAAVSVAASCTCAPRSHEVLLDLMFVGVQTYCFTSGRGLAQVDKLLEVLACVETCTDKPFSHLYPLITEHAASLSGCVCILLSWDQERQQLIKLLRKIGVPMLIIVVTEADLMIEPAANIHVLHPDKLATQLKELTD